MRQYEKTEERNQYEHASAFEFRKRVEISQAKNMGGAV